MALNPNKMKDILKENFFSIEFFNDEGLEKVAEVTGIDYFEMKYEYEVGNILVGQTYSGKFYFYCESSEPDNEITFNSFKRLVEQAIT
jgi:hypothetical protein